MLSVLAGSCDAYSFAVPRVGARTMSPVRMQLSQPSRTYQSDFGDNTYERRQMLATPYSGDAAPMEGRMGEATRTYSPDFGDNTYERRQMLATPYTGA